MTALDLLAELHRLGITVEAADGRLRTRPRGAVPAALAPELVACRADLLALLAATAVGPPASAAIPTCPECGRSDYRPLAGGWRRCWACGRRWGPAGTPDPGLAQEPARSAQLLGLPRRRWAPAPGSEVVIERVQDGDHWAWEIRLLDGQASGAGLFATHEAAARHAHANGWRVQEPLDGDDAA